MELTDKFYQTHCTFSTVDQIKALAKPLERIGISYFTYDKTYDDGSHIRLTSHGSWIESYYRNKLYEVAVFENHPALFCTGHVFWSWLTREPVYSAAAEHDIDHGMTIIEKQAHSCDFYHFGTHTEEHITTEFLVCNLEFLYRFIDSFREKASVLIKEAENNRIILPVEADKNIDESALSVPQDSVSFNELLKKTEVRRLYLGDRFENTYLTRQEINIVRQLTEGKKAVTIASDLSLSSRTLEVHISHIKDKFKCKTLFELGYILGSLGPKSLYPFRIRDTITSENEE